MKSYDQFHDGFFEGILIDGTTAYIHLTTDRKERFTVLVMGVVALTVEGLKAGNIVLGVEIRDSSEVTIEDLKLLYDLGKSSLGESQSQRLLKQVQEKNLLLLEIVPSYGATCAVLARSTEIMSREKWLKLYSQVLASSTI